MAALAGVIPIWFTMVAISERPRCLALSRLSGCAEPCRLTATQWRELLCMSTRTNGFCAHLAVLASCIQVDHLANHARLPICALLEGKPLLKGAVINDPAAGRADQ